MKKKRIYLILTCALVMLAALGVVANNLSDPQDSGSIVDAIRKSHYFILIDIEYKTLYLLQDGKCIKKYPIASGKADTPSPIGNWRIVEKGDWGKGFGGRWMGLDVPWGKYGIHGTTRPGSIGQEASHGCIRMHNNHIKELYSMVPHGTQVIITNGPYGVFGRGFRSISPGDRGADVMAVQKRLKELGFFKGYLSGIYNDDLKRAVHQYQRANQLEVKNAVTRKDYLSMGFREFE